MRLIQLAVSSLRPSENSHGFSPSIPPSQPRDIAEFRTSVAALAER